MKTRVFVTLLLCLALAACAQKRHDDTPARLSALEQAAERGDYDAQFALGMSYYTGRAFGAPSGDMEIAAAWFKMAAEQGLPEAQLMLAKLYLDPDSPASLKANRPQAEALLRSASDRGNVAALFLLGKMYARGEFGARRPVEAAKLLLLAESGGHPLAKTELGELVPTMTRAQIIEANRLVVEWEVTPAVGQTFGEWEMIEESQPTKP